MKLLAAIWGWQLVFMGGNIGPGMLQDLDLSSAADCLDMHQLSEICSARSPLKSSEATCSHQCLPISCAEVQSAI